MAGKFKTCKKCGRIFQFGGKDYCRDCMNEMDEQYRIVRDYLYEYPNATVSEVHKETGVDEDIIFMLVKDGRVEMTDMSGAIRCEKCGRPIAGGRLCPKCKESLSQLFERGKQISMREQENRKREEERRRGGGFKSDTSRSR